MFLGTEKRFSLIMDACLVFKLFFGLFIRRKDSYQIYSPFYAIYKFLIIFNFSLSQNHLIIFVLYTNINTYLIDIFINLLF